MKIFGFSLLFACVLQSSMEAQPVSQPASPDRNAPIASVAPTIVARSANSRIWARISSRTNAAGQVVGNIIGQGINFHVQMPPGQGFGWFLNQNQYLNGSTNVPAFLDPASSSAHVSN